jgi:hypothetical protein
VNIRALDDRLVERNMYHNSIQPDLLYAQYTSALLLKTRSTESRRGSWPGARCSRALYPTLATKIYRIDQQVGA